ncbi:MAG: hydrogenase expression/formation protein HypE [Candidatus Tantalella remota]|nr:hydrogenase expression/formation protein HypE [Candidatus Tantalella remota]
MKRITIAHGSGGRVTHDLVKDVFYSCFDNDILRKAEDSAVLDIPQDRVAFTTDSFVVKPAFFPGGDIGKLAVCGTVNDLAVSGAVPRYITCGFIIEEGLPLKDLKKIVKSMGEWAEKAGVKIVAGDTKVVEKGEADGIFINTSGVGVFEKDIELGVEKIAPGDKILLSGTIGDHGIAVLSRRKGLDFETSMRSDCAPLNDMLQDVLSSVTGVKFMRDPTRGGLATTLNEITEDGTSGILINEKDIPVAEEVEGACQLLGLDPLCIANEGKAIVIVAPPDEDEALAAMRRSEYGKDAALIGKVTGDNTGKVLLETALGVTRIVDMMTAENLPRIC